MPVKRWLRHRGLRHRRSAAIEALKPCAVGVVMACAGAPASAQVTFTVIEDLPGGLRQTTAQAISADGATVVGASNSINGTEAFRWTEATGTAGLGDLPGPGFESLGLDVSADGSVICGMSRSDGFRAWMWTDATGMAALDAEVGFARAISFDGRAVAGHSEGPSQQLEATRWIDRGPPLHLGALVPDTLSLALDISGDGRVLVGTSGDASRSTQAIIWDEIKGMRAITAVSRGADALAASADGSVVVGGAEERLEAGRAFRWTEGSGLVWLTPETVGSRVAAYGVSADGSVVVGGASGQREPDTAFVWTEVAGARDLKELVEARGADLTGWRLIRATDISADGCSLVGYGQRLPDVNEAFVIRFWRRADLDRNGTVDFFDFFEFQSLFAAGDPQADFDGDGKLDFFDFLEFQAATEEGCL